MAASGWRTDSSISDLLFRQSSQFDLFQAVRLLERIFPEQEPVGGFAHPSKEVVRFSSTHSLICPTSLITALDYRSPSSSNSAVPAYMKIAGIELMGYCGVLPYFYTRLLDSASIEFLDLF